MTTTEKTAETPAEKKPERDLTPCYEGLTLDERLAGIYRDIRRLEADGKLDVGKNNLKSYATISAQAEEIRPLLGKWGVTIMPHSIREPHPRTRERIEGKWPDGNPKISVVTTTTVWVLWRVAGNGEVLMVPSGGDSESYSGKDYNAAMTFARRNLYAEMFHLSTEDPEDGVPADEQRTQSAGRGQQRNQRGGGKGSVRGKVTKAMDGIYVQIQGDGEPWEAARSAVKGVTGAKWDKDKKVWLLPLSAEGPALALAGRFGLKAVDLTGGAPPPDVPESQIGNDNPADQTPGPDPANRIFKDEKAPGFVVVQVDPGEIAEELNAKLANLTGSQYSGGWKGYLVPESETSELLAIVAPYDDFDIEDGLEIPF